MVTGLIKHGGEIMEGSRGGRDPGLDCLRPELWELVPRDKLGRVGGCFLRRDRVDIDPVISSYAMVIVAVESFDGSQGVVGRVSAGVKGATGGGGGGGREYFGGVEAGR